MYALKLTKIGDASGIVLPQAVLDKLQLPQDGTVFLIDAPEGLILTAYQPEVLDQLEAGHQFLLEYQEAFRSLYP